MAYPLLAFMAPLFLLAGAFVAFRNPGMRPGRVPRIAEWLALAAFAIAFLATTALTFWGPQTSPLIGVAGIGFSARLDVVSATMLLLVSFIGWVVLRYSATAMDGEARQGRFTGLMSAALASVLLIVIAGNLVQLAVGWVATGAALQKLLLFYADRPGAQRAARKKAIVNRLGEVSLGLAILLLIWGYSTTDIATILESARADMITQVAAFFLAISALLKSAQFPLHGWLTEVMEAPTPVSALLHAGVVNGGGFLMIRFADVMLGAPGVLALLIMVGGFSALFGSLVMLTQPAIKTSLAWSTIAQMGFMILQCGLALFPLALLHVVAHSLYKAHAFLSASEAVEIVDAARRPGPVAIPNLRAVLLAFGIAIAIYSGIALIAGVADKAPQTLALGMILVLGTAYLLAQGLAGAAPRALTQRTALYALAASISYFALQTVATWLTSATLPPPPSAGPLEWTLIALTLVSFASIAVAQSTFPLWANHPAATGLRVHLANGLYANALFDRLVGGWAHRSHS
jgi:NAD(P)H-quinone oxidoreductase subunit 5